MPKFRMFQVDVFAERLFGGNPAAVVVVDEWPTAQLMQAIAAENNLAETAFATGIGSGFGLRWFTPVLEAAFCGHATLAAAHVLATAYCVGGEIAFSTCKVGILKVHPEDGSTRADCSYTLDLPCFAPEPLAPIPKSLCALFPQGWRDVFRNFENIFVVLGSEAELRAYVPDEICITALCRFGLCITARGVAGVNSISCHATSHRERELRKTTLPARRMRR